MITELKKLPMGIEDFKRIRTDNFYYIDKTGLIRDLLKNIAYVTLFTRPRRFGKTLTMSMLRYFFETGSDPSLFDGLEIAKEKELCGQYMGKFPVIAISLKDVTGRNFEKAKSNLRSVIGDEALRFQFLADSTALSDVERRQYGALIELNEQKEYAMSDGILEKSLTTLSHLLQKHCGTNTVLLIDEYDVPLDKAYQSGYYDEMTDLIRRMFGKALKTNDSLQLAVLTGCLRISKESIFTGLNNFKIITIKDVLYNEYFGFTDAEIREMLAYYDKMDRYDMIKEWYDGYRFGDLEVYCPWDVVSYCHELKMNPNANPQNYWVNTSSNDIIRRFVSMAKQSTRNEIEQLIEGGSIRKKIHQELTYRDLDSKIDNLWSLLYTTGYLTQRGQEENGMTELVIPNREINWIFVEQIREWFNEEVSRDSQKLQSFCRAFEENDTAAIEEGFNAYLRKTISIRDTYTRKEMKENFYHGILLGIFGNMDDWDIQSNAESGEGYSDITVEIESRGTGIACYKKRCRVVSEAI